MDDDGETHLIIARFRHLAPALLYTLLRLTHSLLSIRSLCASWPTGERWWSMVHWIARRNYISLRGSRRRRVRRRTAPRHFARAEGARKRAARRLVSLHAREFLRLVCCATITRSRPPSPTRTRSGQGGCRRSRQSSRPALPHRWMNERYATLVDTNTTTFHRTGLSTDFRRPGQSLRKVRAHRSLASIVTSRRATNPKILILSQSRSLAPRDVKFELVLSRFPTMSFSTEINSFSQRVISAR